MKLTALDWSIVAAYFAFNLAVGFYYKSRAGKSTGEFFLGGRNVPWWLAGTSMVATTFAADTPLAVTGMVARNGIAGNWLWWNFVASGMLTVFFYARLWRRSGVMTDVEFAEIRYAGRPAAFLRGFRALYLGIPINCIILGWVNLAMVKILMLILGVDKLEALAVVLGMIVITSFISTLAGLWGVLVTDMFQFVIKMSMVIVLAVAAVSAVGGIDQMKLKLADADRARGMPAGSVLSFVPDLNSAWMPMLTFLVYVSVVWWATWYPGAEPGGGGFVAQRMFCAKDERHSLLATLWFNIAHFALRPWPWILVGLASIILYPNLAGQGERLRDGDDRPSAAIAARADGGGVRRGVHVHDRDAAQLGRQLPGQRFLSALPASERIRAKVCKGVAGGDGAAHGHLGGSHLLHGFDHRRVAVADRHRSGHGDGPHFALVLVADQRVERSVGHERGVCGLDDGAAALWPLERRSAGIRQEHSHYGRRDDRGLADRDFSDRAGAQ